MQDRVSASEPNRQRLLHFVLAFMILQPLLDMVSFWQKQIGIINSITLTIRATIFLFLLIIAYLQTEQKRTYRLVIFGILLYLIGHGLVCAQSTGGYLNFVEDMVEQVRILYLPLTALCFIFLLKRQPELLHAIMDGMLINLFIILIIELLSLLTGTDPHTYPNQKTGVLGWFLWANSQSAILGVLCPLSIAWTWKRTGKQLVPTTAVAAVSFALLYFLGTRLAFSSLVVTGIWMAVCIYLQDRNNRKLALILLLLTAICVGSMQISPMYRARKMQAENSRNKQLLIDQVVSPYVPAGTKKTENSKALETAYQYFLSGLVDRFGLERVAEKYDYSLEQEKIADRRRMLLTGCELLMEDSPRTAQWFGLELGKMRQETAVYNILSDDWESTNQTFDPENDFYGIYYLCGIVGLAAVTIFLLCVMIRSVRFVLPDLRRFFDPLYAAVFLAFGICTVHAWYTVSTLRRNNASVYFACTIAVMWYLSTPKNDIGVSND